MVKEWDDVPVPKATRLDESGLYLWDSRSKELVWVSRPLAFVSGTTALETGIEDYTLQYLNSMNRVVTRTMPASLLTGNGFDSLVEYGVDIRPKTKNAILNYLIQQRSLVPITLTYQTVGWFPDEVAFGGSKLISKSDAEGELNNSSYDLTAKGSRSAWWAMWQRIGSRVELQLALALGLMGSLIAPINRDYPDIKTLFFSLVGNSSSGKTTVATLVLSCAGQPNPGAPGTLARSWSTTANALTLGLQSNFGIPVLYDEMSRYRGGKQSLNDVVYNIAESTEKSRAKRDATLKSTASWGTVVLSTAEFGLLDGSSNLVSTNDGLRVRVLEFSNLNFTGDAATAQYIKKVCATNYGWALPEFVEHLLPLYDELPRRLEPWITEALTIMPDSKYSSRLAVRYGMIGLTLELANETWRLAIDAEKVLKFAIEASSSGWVNDLGQRMYRDLIDYLKVHQRELISPSARATYANVIGQISIHGDEMFVDIFRLEFRRIVTAELQAQSYKVVMSELARLGVLRKESDRTTVRTIVNGERKSVVSLMIPQADQADFVQRTNYDANRGQGVNAVPNPIFDNFLEPLDDELNGLVNDSREDSDNHDR